MKKEHISKELHKAISDLLADISFEAYMYDEADPPICAVLQNVRLGGPNWEMDLPFIRTWYANRTGNASPD